MKKINIKKFYRKIEKHYFILFLVLVFIFLSLDTFIFYNYYYNLKKIAPLFPSSLPSKIYFKEKEYKNVEKELQEREEIFSGIDKKVVKDPFVGLTE